MSSSYQGRHYAGRRAALEPSCAPPPCLQLELRPADSGSGGARGDRDGCDGGGVGHPRRRPSTSPGASRRSPSPSRRRTRPPTPTSRSAVRPPRCRPPHSRAASRPSSGPPATRSARRPPPRRARQGRARGQALGPAHPHLEHHVGLRLALGHDPRRHRPRGADRHAALRDVQGRGHRLVLRLELRQQLEIKYWDGSISWYGHLSKRLVSEGQHRHAGRPRRARRQHRPLVRVAPALRDAGEHGERQPDRPDPLAEEEGLLG